MDVLFANRVMLRLLLMGLEKCMQKKTKYLIFGGAGSVGEELVRQLVEGNQVFIFDINETAFFDLYEELRHKGFEVFGRIGDVRDRRVVHEVFKEFQPDVVFIASACKHVTPMEWFPMEAVQTNVIGTWNVLEECKGSDAKMVYISTDKVINSNSIMGVTKRLGELMTKNAGYVAVRFGNVLGSRGSVIPIWQKQLDEGLPLTITDKDAKRYFMTIEEACKLVIKASEVKGGTIVVMDMGEQVNILQLAKDILGKAGKPDHPIEMIGLRPGETLSEGLMTPEESQRAIKEDNFYFI